jgi:hypothetical protein
MMGEPARIVPALMNDPACGHENRRRRVAIAFRSTTGDSLSSDGGPERDLACRRHQLDERRQVEAARI